MASDEKLSHTTVENVVDNRQSPPKAIVDCSPLQPAINKNKEGKFTFQLCGIAHALIDDFKFVKKKKKNVFLSF